ncbi:MAG: molybdopterin-dependent oxidoreductase, partial [Magnetococcales bacterium]|nr:molybdopterin-dependent oxidoreductase [Magnetococcales bacterium]
YDTTVPLSEALNNDAMLAYEINGQPLTIENGGPLRWIDFNLYGYKQVKRLQGIRITNVDKKGTWETKMQYDPSGKIQPGRIILVE